VSSANPCDRQDISRAPLLLQLHILVQHTELEDPAAKRLICRPSVIRGRLLSCLYIWPSRTWATSSYRLPRLITRQTLGSQEIYPDSKEGTLDNPDTTLSRPMSDGPDRIGPDHGPKRSYADKARRVVKAFTTK
jgi:hypothetical protein